MDTQEKQEDADTFKQEPTGEFRDPIDTDPKTAEEFRETLIRLGMTMYVPVMQVMELLANRRFREKKERAEAREEAKARAEASWEYVVTEYSRGEKSTPPAGLGTGWKICETRVYQQKDALGCKLAILWGREVQDD